MVNPPTSKKATFQTAKDNPSDPRVWLRTAQTVPGSWWPDYAAWLAERSGGRVQRPPGLGGEGFPPQEPAPGTYVLDR
jgi:polyhydroxyalkanoate synthase